jgi:hypothetical protein
MRIRSLVYLSLLAIPVAVQAASLLPSLERAAEVQTVYSEHGGCRGDEVVTFKIEPESGGIPNPDLAYDAVSGQLQVRYRMQFNQLTEGWNWHPLAPMAGDDYYRYKYLPLGGIDEARGDYIAEDKIGSPQTMRVQWHTDYFFAFDNPYEFFVRSGDDDAGFAASIQTGSEHAQRLAKGDLAIALRGRLQPECVAASSTFWKATSARPVDYTLKKRYLIGRLERLWFFDKSTGEVLAELLPSLR